MDSAFFFVFLFVIAEPSIYLGLQDTKVWRRCTSSRIWGSMTPRTAGNVWRSRFPLYLCAVGGRLQFPAVRHLIQWELEDAPGALLALSRLLSKVVGAHIWYICSNTLMILPSYSEEVKSFSFLLSLFLFLSVALSLAHREVRAEKGEEMEKPLRRMSPFSQILGLWLLGRRGREAAFMFINRSVRFHLNVEYYLHLFTRFI